MTIKELEALGYMFNVQSSGYHVIFNYFYIEDTALSNAYSRKIMLDYSYGPRGRVIRAKQYSVFRGGTFMIVRGTVDHSYNKKRKPWDKPLTEQQMMKICIDAAAKHFAEWRLLL